MRTIILVRHGQYSRNPEKLTPLGRKQAQLAARRLKAMKADLLISSTMPRAIETAQIIGKHLKLKLSARKSKFREATLPVRNQDFEKVHETKLTNKERKRLKTKMSKNQRIADRAFKSLFKKPRGPKKGKDKDETIILVAHGNVIRYWVCRALGIDPRRWILMAIHQCSVSTIRIDPKGFVKTLGVSDIGHIPLKSRTYI
jgi:serine/threonine-protein phosphatase PGAM5